MPPPPMRPRRPRPPRDPLAVALANASLLNVGYLMLGRYGRAVATGFVTLVLLDILVQSGHSLWFELVVLLWWAALVANGWFLAGGRNAWAGWSGAGAVRGQLAVALAATLPVLLALGLLRYDAATIGGSLADARRTGDCAKALRAERDIWFGDRLADSPLAADAERTARACRELGRAKADLTTALTGDTGALRRGFDGLASVLAHEPGHRRMVEVVLDGFLRGLPARDHCDTVLVTDWLGARRASHDALDRSAATVARTAPAALIGCGDQLMSAKEWATARIQYQNLLDRYPGFARAAEAREGVRKATLAIELAQVTRLLEESDDATDLETGYCADPVKYSGAPRYRKGASKAYFTGDSEYVGKLPGSWKTGDAAKASLVVCVGEKGMGERVQTCPYEPESGSGGITNVTFRKIAVPVRVYELRTGKRVIDRKLQIGGSSCPSRIHYQSFLSGGPPPDEMYVDASTSDIRGAFQSLVSR
ncbi:hypothetical protein [Actinomadura sp. NEAU-AAG7]|uniref:hypothetical protein n=1 Tax=Actinomadura sp. NEAU-AAG7 TaxID=2839640 RepID=UPI001BE4C55D|nr:hypothetical protein [Actinomadura sp. NEAU-AAG7]MBT2206532.1 hypothetical protein [Actinomadura sp. NEAU-AAG7]